MLVFGCPFALMALVFAIMPPLVVSTARTLPPPPSLSFLPFTPQTHRISAVVGDAAARWMSAGVTTVRESIRASFRGALELEKYQIDETKRRRKSKKRRSKGVWRMLTRVLDTLVVTFIIVLYPVALMSFYQSDNTTDGLRLVTVCFLHPVVQEVTMSLQRISGQGGFLLRKTVNDPRRKHFAVSALGAAHQLEAVFIMYRRLMLGVIRDPTVVMLAIVLTGLEEVIMRSTMVQRDFFFKWLFGLPEPTEEELKLEKRFWAASIATAMYHEFCAIIVSRIAYIAMQPHRYVCESSSRRTSRGLLPRVSQN